MQLLQAQRVAEVRARPSEALVESMRSAARDVTAQRHLVAFAAAREVASGRHQMLPDSEGARVLVDDDILDDGERLQRMTQMRHDDHVAGPDDFASDLGDEDRMIAVACEAIECRRESRPLNSQVQVIVEMKLIVEFLQPWKIELVCASDSYRGRIVGGICSGHQVSYDGAPMFASSSASSIFGTSKKIMNFGGNR